VLQWDLGGLPWWLLQENEGGPIRLRTYDTRFIYYMDRYFSHLLPLLEPLLYENGGPVVMIQVGSLKRPIYSIWRDADWITHIVGQVENEYGYYGDVANNPQDKAYLEHIIEQCRLYLGPHVILYTTDGWLMELLNRGSLNGSQVLTLR